MASPLSNPWVSGGLGVGIVLYFAVAFTPEAWKQPVRDFFTGELKREGDKEPELKIGTEKLFRAVAAGGPEKPEALLNLDRASQQRNLFREIAKGVKERPKEGRTVPELPEGSGLLAVWADGETRVAVMTDGMVREGEPWGPFTVEKITPEAVTLRHEAGERVARLGEVRVKAGVAVAAAPPTAPKPAEGSTEAQVQKLLEMQKAMDPGKIIQGLPKQFLDALMGTPKKPAATP